MSVEIVASVTGWGGMIAIVILTFIQIWMIYQMFKTKDTSKVTYSLFVFNLINNYYWIIYGTIVSSLPIIVTNSISFIASYIYLMLFLSCLNYTILTRTLIILGVGLLLIPGLFLLSYYTIPKLKQVYGIIVIVANCFIFIGPIQNIAKTFQEKDRHYIPIEIVIVLIINCILWIIYGFCLSTDISVIVPNSIGFCLMTFELIVWYYFYNLEKRTLISTNDNLNKDDINEDEDNKALIDNLKGESTQNQSEDINYHNL